MLQHRNAIETNIRFHLPLGRGWKGAAIGSGDAAALCESTANSLSFLIGTMQAVDTAGEVAVGGLRSHSCDGRQAGLWPRGVVWHTGVMWWPVTGAVAGFSPESILEIIPKKVHLDVKL